MPARVGTSGQRRRLCPEVVQTSQMDCGPAAVKALLEGHGLRTSYGRLREACQTDVDGTAIGALEELIGQLGLGIEQVMVPIDHVLLQEKNLPSIAVVLTGTGSTHYVVAWRRHGGWIQVMDPAAGRRFVRAGTFERSLYRHEHPVDAAAWREWAGSEDFTEVLARRLQQLGVDPEAAIARALVDESWRSLAALDATTRFLNVLAAGGAIARDREVGGLVESFVERAVAEGSAAADGAPLTVPQRYWSVRPDPAAEGEMAGEQLLLRGAVLLRVTAPPEPAAAAASGSIGVEMLDAIRQGDTSPWRLLLHLARRRGRQLMAAVGIGVVSSSILAAVEALLLLGLIRAAGQLRGAGQLPAAIASVAVFVAGVAALQLAIASGTLSLGRQLELRVRTEFLRKIPRLGDRFFQSRLRADMAERAHSVVSLRLLPAHVAGLIGSASGLVATAVAIAVCFPDVAALALSLAVLSIAIPVVAQPALLDLAANLRAYGGGLSSYFLDALRGLTAIRAHRGESSLRREHQRVLDLWLRSALSFNGRAVAIDALQSVVGLSLTAAMILRHTEYHGLGGGVLLLTYWALSVPELGSALARDLQQLPDYRSIAARFAEPIEAPEEPAGSARPGAGAEGRGVAIAFEGVSVVAGGHVLLRGVDARFEAGERIAVLGASGAGKSTLLGLLLGWHRAASGRVLVDGAPLETDALARLRQRTAWVDPAVTLWNRSLLFNVRYGDVEGREPIEAIWRAADLRRVIAELPSGLATALGEGGGHLSGGEGQRVRLARALARRDAALVVLDEPFRGLDRARRREALEQAFEWWQGATILCATHDLEVAELFDRAAVLRDGELVECDAPATLSSSPDSSFARMLDAEKLRVEAWRPHRWRRLWMVDGELSSVDDGGYQA